MGFLIDSNVFIAAERGRLDLAIIAEKHAADVLAISAVTASELLYGVYRACTPEIAPAAHAIRRIYLGIAYDRPL